MADIVGGENLSAAPHVMAFIVMYSINRAPKTSLFGTIQSFDSYVFPIGYTKNMLRINLPILFLNALCLYKRKFLCSYGLDRL